MGSEAALPANLLKESFVAQESTVIDAFSRGEEVSMGDPAKYSAQAGVLTFRGGPLRQNAASGTIEIEHAQLSVLRAIRTGALTEKYAGFGVGSQPLIVKWYKNIREMMNIKEDMRNTTAMKEVIFASTDGNIYFFDLDKQIYSREPIEIGFPMTMTPSLNPYGYPLLYVGQTADSVNGYTGNLGLRVFNLIDQKLLAFRSGYDQAANTKKIGTIASSPIVETGSDTILYGAGNGMLYAMSMNTQFDLENAEISVSPTTAAYGYTTNIRNASQGIPGSIAAYGDYVYFGDLAGTIQCVDMNTMQPVWAVNMDDSVIASVSLEVEEDNVYLYAGNVINRRAKSGPIRLVKIDAMTGEIVWQYAGELSGKFASAPAKNGLYAGLMASPLIGQGDINDLVIFNVNRVRLDSKTNSAVVYALDKKTGEEVWSQTLDVDSVSSPVAVYQPDGKSYIVLGDDNGTLRLMDGYTGSTISTVNLGSAIQASPAAYGNTIVVGTTGGVVYFVEIK